MKNCEYACSYYAVPAQIGRRIIYRGKGGVIAKDRGNHIGVNFDHDKPNVIIRIHPTDPDLKYMEMGKIRKISAGQKRYQEYLEADWFEGDFADWIGIKRS